jgi:rhamnosyltransferase subunit B
MVAPLAHDQFDNATRLDELGVGKSLAVKNYHSGRVAEFLGELLQNDQVKSRCTHLASRCDRTIAVRTACDAIDGLHP